MTFNNDISPQFAAAVEEAQRETACMIAFWTKEQIDAYIQGTKVIGATSDELELLSSQAMAVGNLPRALGLGINAQTVECIEAEADRINDDISIDAYGYHPVDRPAFRKHSQ